MPLPCPDRSTLPRLGPLYPKPPCSTGFRLRSCSGRGPVGRHSAFTRFGGGLRMLPEALASDLKTAQGRQALAPAPFCLELVPAGPEPDAHPWLVGAGSNGMRPALLCSVPQAQSGLDGCRVFFATFRPVRGRIAILIMEVVGSARSTAAMRMASSCRMVVYEGYLDLDPTSWVHPCLRLTAERPIGTLDDLQ